MRLFVLFLLVVSCFHSYALESLPVSRSIVWQGQLLEEQITKKILSALGTIVADEHIIVDVKIDMRTPKEYGPDDADNGGGDGGGGAPKGDKDRDKKKENNKSQIKFVDTLPEEELGHYILFSKLGIEAPLIDDYKDEKKETMPSTSGDQPSASQKSNLKEQLKIDRKFDIFNNLEDVLIKVFLDERTPELLKKQVQVVLDSLHFNYGTVIPKITLKYVRMSVVEKKEKGTIIDFLKAFSTPLTIIISVLLFGLILMAIAKKLSSIDKSSGQSSSISIKNELPERESDNDSSGAMGIAGGMSGTDDGSPRLDGIERFVAYYENSPNDAILLVRKWIKTDVLTAKNALRALVQEIDNHTLADIFSKIAIDDREAWKRCLDHVLKDRELLDAKMFIGGQIVEEIMNSGNIDDTELCELLLDISPQQAIELVKGDVDISKLLLNISSPIFVNSIISELGSEDFRQVAQHAVEFDYEGIKGSFDKIKESLRGQLDVKRHAPFVRQLIKLFPNVAPEKEYTLLEIIHSSCGEKDFINLVLEYCPYDAIQSLPKTFLKGVLGELELKNKVSFLLSLSEKDRAFYISIFAPEGSMARDLIGLEINARSADKQFIAEVEKNTSQHHKDFVGLIRRAISKDVANYTENEMALRDWGARAFIGREPQGDNVYDLRKTS